MPTMLGRAGRALAVSALALLLAVPVSAQEPTPTPSPPPPTDASRSGTADSAAWPSGDELRRQLQAIRFDFAIDGSSGDWQGWPPRAAGNVEPALVLDAAGTDEAVARFEVGLLGGDTGPVLTALLEVSTRLPLDRQDLASAQRFIVDDLLEDAPTTLEDCYLSDWEVGALLVTIQAEPPAATIEVAPSAARLVTAGDLALDDCAPLIPEEVVAELSDPISQRVTVAIGGDPPTFEPPLVEVEAPQLTLILTVRNDTDAVQSLAFEPPLDAATGPIEPGASSLIVVREIAPGEYGFAGSGPDGPRGRLRVTAPVE